MSEALDKRLDRIKGEYQELDAAVEWLDEQASKPNMDRAALRSVWTRLKAMSTKLQEEVAELEKALN